MHYRIVSDSASDIEKYLMIAVPKIVTPRLNLNPPLPKCDFVEQCAEFDADLFFPTPFLGLCCEGRGEQIYVLAGLEPSELAKTIAHELRHSFQARTGHHSHAKERDARLFELEFMGQLGFPTDEVKLLRAIADEEDRLDHVAKIVKPLNDVEKIRDQYRAMVAAALHCAPTKLGRFHAPLTAALWR